MPANSHDGTRDGNEAGRGGDRVVDWKIQQRRRQRWKQHWETAGRAPRAKDSAAEIVGWWVPQLLPGSK